MISGLTISLFLIILILIGLVAYDYIEDYYEED